MMSYESYYMTHFMAIPVESESTEQDVESW